MGGAISALIADGEIKGKRGEMTLIHTLGTIAPKRVLVAGLGKAEAFTLDGVRSVAAESARRLNGIGVESAATIVHGAGIAGPGRQGERAGSRGGRGDGDVQVRQVQVERIGRQPVGDDGGGVRRVEAGRAAAGRGCGARNWGGGERMQGYGE